MNTVRLHLAGAGTALALGLAAGFLPASPAQAQTFVPCHDIAALKDAINQANSAGRGVISLAAGCTYTLTDPDTPGGADGLPPITGDVRIRPARTRSGAVITRSATASSGFRIFHVTGGGALSLNAITLRNGRADRGGGIYNEGGAVTVNAGVISGDRATGSGGGIFSQGGSLVVNATVISGNQAHSGGGISNGAPGGDSTAILTATVVTGNTATGGQGGGIYSGPGSTLMLVASSITGNTPDNCFRPGSGQDCGGLVIAFRPAAPAPAPVLPGKNPLVPGRAR